MISVSSIPKILNLQQNQTLQLLKFLKIFNPLIPRMAQHFYSPYNVIPESMKPWK